ncbi:RND family efflux transporter, MFP subunit [Longilinea arvoryzae]|uniref:RND family efflux transporter, MFP subunit n=1 Tax=Longilinea arvoryzae TaxID=360412 RepID=A0A0S7BGS5_9CHLR|nr:efflux RND transporter periplasmic adaptor subunit [Longilinea arvoryzae]GAP12933.1 RND family efflux transporter, MFP subunit [Longilinea arvoryzae]
MAVKFKFNFKLSKRLKKWILPAAAVLVVMIGAGGYFLWNQARLAKAAGVSGTTLNTAQVKIGDLTLSASGSGTLVAGQQADLAFPIAGMVKSVNVTVGQTVTKGDVLAELADTSALDASLATADLNVKLAQQTLDNLTINAPSTLAAAKVALVNAQEAYADAKNTVKSDGMARCDTDTTEAYKERYDFLKSHLDSVTETWDGKNMEFYLNTIVPIKDEVDKAYANYVYCQKYFESEIVDSQANVTEAEVTLKQAQSALDTLQANNGIDPIELAKAQSALAEARVAYAKAETDLANAKLTAPFDGTVLSVAGEAGSTAATGTFISIIDLSHPKVEFSVDESDMDKIKVGNTADVVFDALPDDTFTGKVTQVTPQLVSTGGYQVLTGVIQLELSDAQGAEELIAGLNASVEVIAADAQGAVLVPLDALRDLGDGQYAVFVVGIGNTLKMQTVTIGIKDDYYAQVLSGLEGGETVSTGLVETK